MWETPPDDAHIERKNIDTDLSKAICSFMLVNRVDTGNGYLRCEYVKESDVSESILDEAGRF